MAREFELVIRRRLLAQIGKCRVDVEFCQTKASLFFAFAAPSSENRLPTATSIVFTGLKESIMVQCVTERKLKFRKFRGRLLRLFETGILSRKNGV